MTDKLTDETEGMNWQETSSGAWIIRLKGFKLVVRSNEPNSDGKRWGFAIYVDDADLEAVVPAYVSSPAEYIHTSNRACQECEAKFIGVLKHERIGASIQQFKKLVMSEEARKAEHPDQGGNMANAMLKDEIARDLDKAFKRKFGGGL